MTNGGLPHDQTGPDLLLSTHDAARPIGKIVARDDPETSGVVVSYTQNGKFRHDVLSQSGPQSPAPPRPTWENGANEPILAPPEPDTPLLLSARSNPIRPSRDDERTQPPAPAGRALGAVEAPGTRRLSARSKPIAPERSCRYSTRFCNELKPTRQATNEPDRRRRPASAESPDDESTAPGFRAIEPKRLAPNQPNAGAAPYLAFRRWARVRGDALYDRHRFVSTVRRVATQGDSLAADSAQIIPDAPDSSSTHQIRIG